MIRLLPLVVLLAGCSVDLGGQGDRDGPSASDFVGSDSVVTPGLASCATAIGRPDLASDPNAAMSNEEIDALLTCTAARAQG
ncbi:hypothetical protein N9W17_01170 [Jannaschia sp.]|nr:hypothetical protein [Jannaschia sp.]